MNIHGHESRLCWCLSASKQIFIVTAVVTVAVVAVAADEMRMDKLKKRFDIRSRDRNKERKKLLWTRKSRPERLNGTLCRPVSEAWHGLVRRSGPNTLKLQGKIFWKIYGENLVKLACLHKTN